MQEHSEGPTPESGDGGSESERQQQKRAKDPRRKDHGRRKSDQPAKQPPLKAAYVLVILAMAGAALLTGVDSLHFDYVLNGSDFQWFAGLYVVALAIERLLEPLMKKVSGEQKAEATKEVQQTQRALLAVASANPPANPADTVKEADQAKAQKDQVEADRAIWAWALASTFALLASGALGLGILESIGSVGDQASAGADKAAEAANAPKGFRILDVWITGLAIGAGTKPLHDLVSRIEASKKNADKTADPATVPSTGG